MSLENKTIVRVVVLLLITVLSFFVLSGIASSPTTYQKTIASLDEKKSTVTGLAAASISVSSAITLIPGDTATPIANELADLSTYFMVILSAVFLEKYLLTIIGFIVFKILIPAACLLSVANTFYKSDVCRAVIKKLIIIGVVFLCVIPASERISGLIQKTYDESMQATIELANQEVEYEETEEGVIAGFVSKVKNGVTETTQKVENILTNFLEAVAVMIVTSCVIPILVLVFFVWFIKFMLGININFMLPEKIINGKKKEHKIEEKEDKKIDVIEMK